MAPTSSRGPGLIERIALGFIFLVLFLFSIPFALVSVILYLPVAALARLTGSGALMTLETVLFWMVRMPITTLMVAVGMQDIGTIAPPL